MGSQGPGRKRNPNKNVVTPEEDALTIIAREAEGLLAAKRYDRVESHEVRLRELERQQKEVSVDEHMSMERRTSTLDSLAEMEEKYHKAMVSNALLDNEKSSLMFEVDTMKDSLTELEERLAETCREFEEKCKDLEREKQAHSILKFQFSKLKDTLKQSEELLTKHGIVLRPDLCIKWDVGGVTNGSAITEIQQENNTLGTEEEQKGRDENRSGQPRDFDHGLEGNLLPKKRSSFLESSLVAQNEHVGLRHDLNKGLGQIPNSVEKSQNKSDTEASRSALELKEEIKAEGTVVLKTPEGIVAELEHISFNKDCVRRDQHESPVYFRHERTKKENTAPTNDAHEVSAKDGDYILETVIPNAQAKDISLVSSQIIDSNTPKSQSDNISGKKRKRKKKNKQKQNKSYEKMGNAETGKNNENQQKTVKNNEDSTVVWRMESNSDCNCILEEPSDEAQANEKITTLNNEEKFNPVHKALVYAIRQDIVESVNNRTECPSSSNSTSALKGLPTDDLELQSSTNYRKSGNHNLVYTSNTELKFLSNIDISVNDGLRTQLLNMVANSVDLSASLEVKCEKDVTHAAKYIAEMETAGDIFNLDETNTSPETSIGSNLGGMAFKDKQDDIVLPEGIQKSENAKKKSALVDQEAKMEENETELYCGNSFEFDGQDLKSSSDSIPKCLPVESDMEVIVPKGSIENKNECRQTQESVDAFSEQISEPKGLTDACH